MSSLFSVSNYLLATFGDYLVAIKIFTIILITGILNFFISKYIKKVIDYYKPSNRFYDDVFLEAAKIPLQFFIWLMGLYFSIYILNFNFDLIVQIKSIVNLFLFVWFVLRFVSKLEVRIEEKIDQGLFELNKTTLRALCQLFKASTIITCALIALQVFGVPVSGVLAFGGIGGIGVAFAAKDLLANFFGGLMIYLDRPFEVGDWIRSPDKDVEGTVEHIGWRLTSIRTFDQRLRYVPNSLFSIITIDNPSRMRNRRIKTLVGVRYQDSEKIAEIINAIKNMLKKHTAIDARRVMLVNLIEFGSSSLNIQIYTFTKTVDWAEYLNIQQDVFLKVLAIIKKFDADCAFPTRTIHVDNSADLSLIEEAV